MLAVQIQNMVPTGRSRRSTIRMATAGFCRRSPRDCPVVLIWRDLVWLRNRAGERAGRAEAAHGEHEKRSGGQRDANWPEWYASFMAAEQAKYRAAAIDE